MPVRSKLTMNRIISSRLFDGIGRALSSESSLASACRMSATLVQSKDGKAMHPDLLNEAIKRTQYAVRGELYLRAMELQKEGMKITFTNGAATQPLRWNAHLHPCCSLAPLDVTPNLCLHSTYLEQYYRRCTLSSQHALSEVAPAPCTPLHVLPVNRI